MSQFDCSWRRHQAIKPTRFLRTSSRPKKQWQIEQNSNHTTKIIRLMMKLERGWLKNGPITKFGWCSFSSWLNFLHPGKTKRENAVVLLHSTRKWAQSELVTLWRLSLHVGCLRRRLSSEWLWFDSRLRSLSCCSAERCEEVAEPRNAMQFEDLDNHSHSVRMEEIQLLFDKD